MSTYFLSVEDCPSRMAGEWHCDHEADRHTRFGVIISRTWQCCFCGREHVEFPKPLTETSGVYTHRAHGPYARKTFEHWAAERSPAVSPDTDQGDAPGLPTEDGADAT